MSRSKFIRVSNGQNGNIFCVALHELQVPGQNKKSRTQSVQLCLGQFLRVSKNTLAERSHFIGDQRGATHFNQA